MDEDSKLTERERRIWDAAYAAAFVADYELLRSVPPGGRKVSSHARAIQVVSAGHAVEVADHAVYRLREFQAEEESDAGEKMSEWQMDRNWDEEHMPP